MKSLTAATFSGAKVLEMSEPLLALLPKKDRVTARKALKARLVASVKSQPKPKVIRTSAYTLAHTAYKSNLRDLGFSGLGRPTSEMVKAAMLRLTAEELKALHFGKTTKWRKESPAAFVVSASEPFASLR